MKSDREIGRYGLFLWSTTLIILLVMSMNTRAAGGDEKISTIVIWDTTLPFNDSVDLQSVRTPRENLVIAQIEYNCKGFV